MRAFGAGTRIAHHVASGRARQGRPRHRAHRSPGRRSPWVACGTVLSVQWSGDASIGGRGRRLPEGPRLLAGRGAGDRRVPGHVAAAAAAARGRGRRRQDRAGQGPRPLDRRRADPPAVLRGHRRRPGRLRLGLRPPAPPPARRRGHRRVGRPDDRLAGVRAVPGALPRQAGAAAGDRAARGSGARAARRRGRPLRRRVRGVPAGGPVRLADHGPRARHVPRRHAAARRADEQPHPRRPRRPQAALPLPLGRAPRLRPRGRHRAAARARGRRVARPPGRRPPSPRCARLSLYKPPGVAETIDWAAALGRLGVTELDERSVEATLGTVLKYREDHERVVQHGIADVVKQALARQAG